jgi:AraC-like DNA-binding protein/mannose-6-phosphate isomerase-like protein (cupin superfamily)
MPFQREEIQFSPDETFRLLRWSRSVERVSVVRGGIARAIRGQGDRWHYHRAMELTFIQSGSGTRFVADHIELFDSGDLVLIGANVPHYWHQHGSSAGVSVQWDFPREHGVWSLGEAVAPLRELSTKAQRGFHVRGETARVISEMMAGLQTTIGLPRLADFFKMLSFLAGAPSRDVRALAARPFALDGTAEQQEAVQRAVSFILAHYREAVRLDPLLVLTGMSRATFARQFARHAGKSFSVFLNQVRLQAVCRALRETAEPISAIAFSNGFNQLSFFNRLFRREFGKSPSEFRSEKST